jgi:hypothetical protein
VYNIKKIEPDELGINAPIHRELKLVLYALSHEHVGPKILAEIEIYILTRAKLPCPLCHKIPCITLAADKN